MEKMYVLILMIIVYLIVSGMFYDAWETCKLIWYGLIFVYKTTKLFGIKNGMRCLKAVIKDIM